MSQPKSSRATATDPQPERLSDLLDALRDDAERIQKAADEIQVALGVSVATVGPMPDDGDWQSHCLSEKVRCVNSSLSYAHRLLEICVAVL